MDHVNVPSFAMLRYGTVITRLKNLNMESFLPTCGQLFPERFTRLVHRLSRCEQCTRTRIVSQCSDCDSELVGKCRPYRTRAAKSRYVNVCAAVCLLLLVGGLTPSSAAPHRWRTMDRSKRAASASDQENETWSNPCDYNESSLKNQLEYKPELAGKVAMQARDALDTAKGYRSDIAKLHGYVGAGAFEDMLNMWQETVWLQNHSWFTHDILPENKKFGKPIDDKTLEGKMTPEKIAEILPLFSIAMKTLGAALRSVSSVLLDPYTYGSVKRNLESTSDNMRHVLCLTSDVIRARNLEMVPLNDSDIPQYSGLPSEDIDKDVFLIYRDTVNFLEYVEKFFDKMTKTQLK